MQYLIVSDVFGKTDALVNFSSELKGLADIIDPYHSEHMKFEDETQAYNFFVANVGIDRYEDKIIKKIQSYSEPIQLIGFSVGSSAIWKLSAQNDLTHIKSAICFYGSQIRHHKKINPQFPITLVFPSCEKHFSVSELVTELSIKINVKIIKTSYSHGFMNRYSINFDQSAYEEYVQKVGGCV